MSTKRKSQANQAEASQTDTPSAPRAAIAVRVKTRQLGQRRVCCGVIITGEWKHLVVDDKGSAYKTMLADQDLVVERLPDAPKAAEAVTAEPEAGNAES